MQLCPIRGEMMALLHRYMVAYDISDPVRLRRVEKIMTNHGSRVQLSVFICDLTQQSRVRMKQQLSQCIFEREDSVMIIDFGYVDASRKWPIEYLGLAKSKELTTYKIV